MNEKKLKFKKLYQIHKKFKGSLQNFPEIKVNPEEDLSSFFSCGCYHSFCGFFLFFPPALFPIKTTTSSATLW